MGWLPISLIVAGVILALLLWLRPAIPVRFALALFVRLFYRMRIIGQENIPAEGPALLVCNHVSYLDWLFLVVAQRRVIRFVVFAGWTNTPVIRHLLRWGKVIPIDASSGPRAIVKSLQAAGEALKRGDLVCIFAEGRFTRTGFLLPFRRGFEEIAKRGGAPIIPVCLDELWGSIFSFYGDRCLWKLPRQLPYSVTVAFGNPMPGESSAEQVRLAVQQLAADAAISRSEDLLPVHRQFVRTAARRRFSPAIMTGEVLKYRQVLARSICLMWQLRARLGDAPVVGIWMPRSAEAAIANLAVAFSRKAVVNLSGNWPSATLQDVVQKCNVRHVLVSGKFHAAQPLPPFADGIEVVDIESLQSATPRRQRSMAWLAALFLPGFALDRFVVRLNGHRLADLAAIFVSGANSNLPPKLILHTHVSIAAAVSSLVKTYDLSRRDVLICEQGFDYCVEYTLSFWAPLSNGMPVAYAYPSMSSQSPTESPANQNGRLVVAKHSGKVMQLLHTVPSEFAIPVSGNNDLLLSDAYSCGELASIVATNVPDKTLEGFTQIGNKTGTVGQPLAGMAARVVNPETFEALPTGQHGLLQFRSASLMAGYLNDEEGTKKAIRDGWFSTGDIARIDEQGFITLVT
jgi:acyl-[acyl-carrier-protein]-phospholipid O-acyltransferase / long-chain-fatty-acid--[acyl-carrier-protein] ligase